MYNIKIIANFLAIVLAVQGASVNKPRPQLSQGTYALGMIMPQLSGWGPQPTTTEGTTTTSSTTSTTTPVPETTTETPTTTSTTTTLAPETTTGWSTPETTTGWSAPDTTTQMVPTQTNAGSSNESVSIEIVGESAVIGEGEVGATHGSETSVTGDGSSPAVAIVNTGSSSSLGQGSGILQISSVADGNSNTFQGIDAYNIGDSSEFYGGSLSGAQLNTVNGGGSFVIGNGAIGQAGITLNNKPQIPQLMGAFQRPQ